MYDYEYWDDFDCEIQCEELIEYDFSDIPDDPLNDEGLPF